MQQIGYIRMKKKKKKHNDSVKAQSPVPLEIRIVGHLNSSPDFFLFFLPTSQRVMRKKV
jgi:hypothetical protein